MNVITILIDSLNFHCLQPYGAAHVRTPNLQRFAERACVFDNHFIGSAPCMPARRELFTGRQEFLWRPWGPIEPWDRHLAAEARRTGAVTQMITDHYHYWENSAHGFFEPFDGVDFIRGHESDMWQTQAPADCPPWAAAIDRYRPGTYAGGRGSRYYVNARQWKEESEYPCAQVMTKSAKWLKENCPRDKFLLWVEGFDPHEPHYLPPAYRNMYTGGRGNAAYNCWPPYQNQAEHDKFLAEASDDEIAWIRAQYYGKVTMVDHWLGRLFAQLDAQDLWKDTAVVLTTDHGHDLCYSRNQFPCVWAKAYPHPESHARIPLMIWHPEFPGQGRRIDALTCALDVNATLRELLGIPEADGPHGRSLLPLVRGKRRTHRDYVLYGKFGCGANISTREWTLAQGSRGEGPLYSYSTTALQVSPEMTSGLFIPGVNIPQWRVPARSLKSDSYLWDRSTFSLTPENLLEKRPDKAQALRELLKNAIEESGAPPETFRRLGL